MLSHFLEVWSAPVGWAYLRLRPDGRGGAIFEFHDPADAGWKPYSDDLVRPALNASADPKNILRHLRGAITLDPPGPCHLALFTLDAATGRPVGLFRVEVVAPGMASSGFIGDGG